MLTRIIIHSTYLVLSAASLTLLTGTTKLVKEPVEVNFGMWVVLTAAPTFPLFILGHVQCYFIPLCVSN